MSSPTTTAPASSVQPSAMHNTRNTPRPSGGARHLAPGGPATRRATHGSATQTITPEDTASSRSVSPDPLVLRLRGAHGASGTEPRARRRIQWAEDVVDNEGLGRKSSKVCCIYHKTRRFGESSSEEDSSSDGSDSGGDGSDSPDDGAARMGGIRRGKKQGPGHSHRHGDDCGHGHEKGKGKRKPSPNAYERMPKHNLKPESEKR